MIIATGRRYMNLGILIFVSFKKQIKLNKDESGKNITCPNFSKKSILYTPYHLIVSCSLHNIYICTNTDILNCREFVFDSGIGEIAAAFMGSSYSVFYHEHVLNKEPGTS